MDISVIGGTGEEGFGLTLRLGRAGQHVIIGSRSEEKGAATAQKAREILGGDARVDGTTNEAAAEQGDVIFVTVPYAGQADIYRAIKDHVAAGKIVVDCTSPSRRPSAVALGTSSGHGTARRRRPRRRCWTRA